MKMMIGDREIKTTGDWSLNEGYEEKWHLYLMNKDIEYIGITVKCMILEEMDMGILRRFE